MKEIWAAAVTKARKEVHNWRICVHEAMKKALPNTIPTKLIAMARLRALVRARLPAATHLWSRQSRRPGSRRRRESQQQLSCDVSVLNENDPTAAFTPVWGRAPARLRGVAPGPPVRTRTRTRTRAEPIPRPIRAQPRSWRSTRTLPRRRKVGGLRRPDIRHRNQSQKQVMSPRGVLTTSHRRPLRGHRR